MAKVDAVYRLTVDRIGPSLDFILTNVSITGDGSNNGSVTLYEGTGTDGDVICTLRTESHEMNHISFDRGRFCEDGIYADLTNVDEVVLVGHHPD